MERFATGGWINVRQAGGGDTGQLLRGSACSFLCDAGLDSRLSRCRDGGGKKERDSAQVAMLPLLTGRGGTTPFIWILCEGVAKVR